MSKKRVLIITYYWPPSGGSGVQRWLKFVKYLPQFGWDPIVYTPSNPEYPAIDHSLIEQIPSEIEVIKQPIVEPYEIYRRFSGKTDKVGASFISESGNQGTGHKIAVWIRGNLFIPDARRFWIRPSVRYLNSWLKKNPVDLMVSTGPPHSMHLIAQRLRKTVKIPWIADFRDPWTEVDYYADLNVGKRAHRQNLELESSCFKNADLVIAATPGMMKSFRNSYPNATVSCITNGYDSSDYLNQSSAERDGVYTIVHSGTLGPSRNPEKLWSALKRFTSSSGDQKQLKIRLIGRVDFAVKEHIERCGLREHVEYIEYIPHQELIHQLSRADAFLLIVNRAENASAILTGKVFEYLALKRPILAIGPKKSDISDLLTSTKSGLIRHWDDEDGMLEAFEMIFKEKGESFSFSGSERYERRFLTGKLTEKFEEVLSP